MSKKNVKKKTDIFFPDDIIIEILSRLPAEKVHRFRLVCRRWRDLTSTLDFVNLHMRRSIPMIYVEHYSMGADGNRLLFDNWWEPDPERLVFHSFQVGSDNEYEYYAKFSQGGSIVYQHENEAIVRILNPKTRPNENIVLDPKSHPNVKISLPEELLSSEIYGVFFHPLLGEYCTLWRIYVGVRRRFHPELGYYKMLNLGSKPCWRDISNPWSHRVKVTGYYGGRLPVLIGECLYWLVEPEQVYDHSGRYDVMKFDIRSEKLGLMHCPVPSNVDCVHSGISLLDIDGVLSFVVTSRNRNLVNVSIWKLKDGAQQLWVTMNHSIRIEDYPRDDEAPIATAVVGKHLLLMVSQVVRGKSIYVCNLELGNAFFGRMDNLLVSFAHVMGLASLRNCKSEIYMDEEGEVGEDPNVYNP